MTEPWAEERHAVLQAAQEMFRRGLVTGTAGNVSMRCNPPDGDELYLITPAAAPYETMSESDLVLVDGDLEPVDGSGIPSTESLLHLAIYRARRDVGAVAHTHSVFATAAAAAGKPIPPIVDEMVIYIGGGIELAAYAPPASEEIAENAVQALGERRAVLLAHHGLCAVGGTPRQALDVCILAERVAQVYFYAAMVGGARTLPEDVIAAEREAYRMRAGL